MADADPVAELAELRELVEDLRRRVARLEGSEDADPLRDGTVLWREAMKVKNQATGRN